PNGPSRAPWAISQTSICNKCSSALTLATNSGGSLGGQQYMLALKACGTDGAAPDAAGAGDAGGEVALRLPFRAAFLFAFPSARAADLPFVLSEVATSHLGLRVHPKRNDVLLSGFVMGRATRFQGRCLFVCL